MFKGKNITSIGLILIGIAIGGAINLFYWQFDQYQILNNQQSEANQFKAQLNVENTTLTEEAKALEKQLAENKAFIAESLQLTNEVRKKLGESVYLLRLHTDSYQVWVRAVQKGVCPTVPDGCRSDNDLLMIPGNYPEIIKAVNKLPDSVLSGPIYKLVIIRMESEKSVVTEVTNE